jgi:hypothetical protein
MESEAERAEGLQLERAKTGSTKTAMQGVVWPPLPHHERMHLLHNLPSISEGSARNWRAGSRNMKDDEKRSADSIVKNLSKNARKNENNEIRAETASNPH